MLQIMRRTKLDIRPTLAGRSLQPHPKRFDSGQSKSKRWGRVK